MSNLHTLQILQKNTLSSLQSLIDFTNATLVTPPTLQAIAPTPPPAPTTLSENMITFKELEPLFRDLFKTEREIETYMQIYAYIYGIADRLPSHRKLLRLLDMLLGEKTQINNKEILTQETAEVIAHISPETPIEEKLEDDEEEEEDDKPIQDTYDWYNGVVLSENQKIYKQLLFTQNWKELARRYMLTLKHVFEPYFFEIGNDDVDVCTTTNKKYPVVVKTPQEYKFLVQIALENRNKFGDVILPDTLIQWDKLPETFLNECKKVYKAEILFQPATLKYPMFCDVLKVYRYFSRLQGHYTWKSKFQILKESSVGSQDLITSWIQNEKVNDQQRDYVITAITFANFGKSVNICNPVANYIGSNQFSQNFFTALENTKELPNGFMNWITKGIKYKHFKKVLTDLEIQQVRRAEGQRYQGIHLLNEKRIDKANEKDPLYIESYDEKSYTRMNDIFSSNNDLEPYSIGEGYADFNDDRELFLTQKMNITEKNADIICNSKQSTPAFNYASVKEIQSSGTPSMDVVVTSSAEKVRNIREQSNKFPVLKIKEDKAINITTDDLLGPNDKFLEKIIEMQENNFLH